MLLLFFLTFIKHYLMIFFFPSQDRNIYLMKADGLEKRFQSSDSSDHPMVGSISGRHELSCLFSQKLIFIFHLRISTYRNLKTGGWGERMNSSFSYSIVLEKYVFYFQFLLLVHRNLHIYGRFAFGIYEQRMAKNTTKME